MEPRNSESRLTQANPSKTHFSPLSTLCPNLPRPSQRRVVRIMAGRCIYTEEQQDATNPYMTTTKRCMCPAGEFSLNTTLPTSDPPCSHCGHSLSSHEDINSPQSESIHARTRSRTLRFVPDPLRCPREDTVSALWERIQEQRLLHIRATPASGKSTLSRLLEQYVQRKEPELPVYWCSWPPKFPKDVGRAYQNLLNYAFSIPQDHKINWLELQALLIIDEAQESYSFSTFWNDFIKSEFTPLVALFSSWGSASRKVEVETGTPVYLEDEQRISIRAPNSKPGIFFTRDEYLDVVERVQKSHSQYGQLFQPSREAVDYIWHVTNGHPAAVRITLDILATSKEVRELRKAGSEISLDVALDVLGKVSDIVSRLLGNRVFSRGLPTREFLQEEPGVVDVLKRALVSNNVKGVWEKKSPSEDPKQVDQDINTCYRKGWLQAELSPGCNQPQDTVYVFASVLHRRCIESMLCENAPKFPKHKFSSVDALCMSAVQRFSRTALNNGEGTLGSGAVPRPLEAVYQDELYRACFSLLGNIYISSEWSGKDKNGRVDFLVRQVNWAIECVRDGSRLDEHISRFRKGGRYYQWIENGEITEYIVLDFRRRMPTTQLDIDFPLFYIVFNNDYSRYQVYDGKLEPWFDKEITLLNA